MPEWMVRLAGPERDLRFVADRLKGSDWRVSDEEGGRFYLRAQCFEDLAHAGEVKRAADEMIECANLAGLLRFKRYQGVRTGEVVRVDPDGSRQVTISVSGAVKLGEATAFGFASVVGGEAAPLPDFSRDMAAVERRPLLKKAIEYVLKEPGWFSYWKAAEALGQEIGGLDRIHELHGWASKDQFKRFEKTVHHHRHHRVPAPPNPMSESEAKAFIIDLLRRCLEWTLAGRPKPA